MSEVEPLWVERFRPKTIADCVLPKALKSTFQKFVDAKTVPNLLLTGRAGIGKTTVARAILEELGCDYIIINGSLEGRNIDTLRNDILQYASSMSLTNSGRKYVILDEADYLNMTTVQPALRNFMEEYSDNCGFILTANYPHRIMPELHSRCSVIEFRIGKNEKAALAKEFMSRVVTILKTEKVEYDQGVVAAVITKFFPDWRRTLNELQRYAINGKIDSGILGSFQETTIKELIGHMKDKNFTNVRKWVAAHSDIPPVELFRSFYDLAAEYFDPRGIPPLVILLAKYQDMSSRASDQEINTSACMLEIMLECPLK
jgi:DNA polymerase III delta prime subunit